MSAPYIISIIQRNAEYVIVSDCWSLLLFVLLACLMSMCAVLIELDGFLFVSEHAAVSSQEH